MSFWTLCPYCWVLYQYEKKYEECSLRCQNCRRAFHGLPVDPPPSETVVSGKDQYYCYHAYLPVRYPAEKEAETKRGKERAKRSKNLLGEDFSDISEVVGGQSSGFQVGEDGPCGKARFEEVCLDGWERMWKREFRAVEIRGCKAKDKRRMKIKSVAKSTKKISGNKLRFGALKPPHWQEEFSDSDEEHDGEFKKDEAKTSNGCEDDVFEFTEREGEIFVGIR